MDPIDLFKKLGGEELDGFPRIDSEVFYTDSGTPYLKRPGVVLLAKPDLRIDGIRTFLEGFDPSLEFPAYLDDPTELPPAAGLSKVAGQTCYASFGPKRTYNEAAGRYFSNQREGGHGSVLEHATFSFLCYGISRSNTHEVVRHRAGTAYSQLSQRYVSGKVLRFVERPEYQEVPSLHDRFCDRIDRAWREYHEVADELAKLQKEGHSKLSAERRTDLRKRLQQTARSVLPNETETILVMSANVRAWRHIVEMRTDQHAEAEIRELFLRVFLCLVQAEPILFEDYRIQSYSDDTYGASTDWRKV